MKSNERYFNECVQATIDSGIPPLEFKFYPIVDLEDNNPIAYRTKLTLNAIPEGVMQEVDYTYVSDNREIGINLFKHMLKHIIKCYKSFMESNKEIEFLSIRVPSDLVTRASLYDVVKEVLETYQWFDPKVLCLEFEDNILKIDSEKAKYALLDMRLLKVKTAIIGCGREDFKDTKLLTVTPDYVYLDESFTSNAGSRNKPQLVRAMVDYMDSMYIKCIAIGSKEFLKPLRNTDCIGFYDIDTLPLDLSEAIKEEERDE